MFAASFTCKHVMFNVKSQRDPRLFPTSVSSIRTISVGYDDPATHGSGRTKYCKLNRPTLQPRPPPKPPLATPYIWFPFFSNTDLKFCIISVGHDDPGTQGSGRKKYCKLNRHLHVLVDINIRRDLPPNPLPIQC